MFAQARASLYEFAARIAYDPLDANFVTYTAQRFAKATRRELDEARGLEILRLLGNQPEAYLSVVQAPLARADRTLDQGLEALLLPDGATPWVEYWKQSTALQRAILTLSDSEVQLTSEAGCVELGRLLGGGPVNPSSVRRATDALLKRGLIERTTLSTKAIYGLTDPVFDLWIKQNAKELLKLSHLDLLLNPAAKEAPAPTRSSSKSMA
jgi:hypothetical protein